MSKNTKTAKTVAFRAGSKMQKGFAAYSAVRKTYVAADAVKRRTLAERIAKRLDTTLNSVRTMITKNWEPALTR